MIVNVQHSATAAAARDHLYRCATCGHRQLATAVAIATGTGNALDGIDNSGARERAQGHAHDATRRELERAFARVRCPKCGKRPAGARTTALLMSLGAALAFAAIVRLSILLITKGQRMPLALGVAIGLFVVVLPIDFKLRLDRTTVIFLDGPVA